jgi:hypothetical protein
MSPRTTSTRSKRRPSASATAAAAALALSGSSSPAAVNAFALLPGASPARSFAPPSTLFAASGESPSNDAAVASRRDVLQRSLGIFAAGLAFAGNAQPASASYSAYTAREQDWDNRKKTGDISVSSARDLKKQLREIVPQNSEGSKIFCPNGPSSAVSPLMENKCGDLMATPSVFGRTDDTVGNSIPGFKAGYNMYPSVGSSTASLSDNFPSYGDVGATKGRKNSNVLD